MPSVFFNSICAYSLRLGLSTELEADSYFYAGGLAGPRDSIVYTIIPNFHMMLGIELRSLSLTVLFFKGILNTEQVS